MNTEHNHSGQQTTSLEEANTPTQKVSEVEPE
jgi:hypothetical protein